LQAQLLLTNSGAAEMFSKVYAKNLCCIHFVEPKIVRIVLKSLSEESLVHSLTWTQI